MIEKKRRSVSVRCMKLRDLGNSYGFTISKEGLNELDLLDEDGELVEEDLSVRSTIYEDGTVRYEIPLEEVEDVEDV